MKSLFLILIVFLTILPASAQINAPYLYYFDRAESGFVIERADGTDHHVLAQGKMPGEVGSVTGPGWSPSGQFLAWQGIIGRVQIHEATFLPYAMNIQTGQFVSQLDIFEETFVLDWHPSKDWLLAIGLLDITEDNFRRKIFRMALIDATTNTTLAAYNAEELSVAIYQWQPEGLILAQRVLDSVEFLRMNAQGVTRLERPAASFSISPEGHLVYDFGNGGWAVENLSTRQTAILESDLPTLEDAEWQGSRALIEDDGLWLVDLETFTISQIADEILPAGRFTAGAGTVFLGNHRGFWSPDGQHFAYRTVDQELIVSDGVMSTTLVDNVVGWGWVDAETIIVALNDKAAPVFMEMSINDDHQSAKIVMGNYPVWFSPDQNRAAGFTYEGPWIKDIGEDTLLNLPRHSAVDPTADYGGEMFWHAASEWLIIKETPFVSMMGDDPALNTVIRTDGEFRRELPSCFIQCVKWLSEQVNIQNLPESD